MFNLPRLELKLRQFETLPRCFWLVCLRKLIKTKWDGFELIGSVRSRWDVNEKFDIIFPVFSCFRKIPSGKIWKSKICRVSLFTRLSTGQHFSFLSTKSTFYPFLFLYLSSHSSFTSSIISRQRCNEKLCCHSPHTHNHKFMWFSVNMKFVAHLKMGFCGFHNTFWSLSLTRSVAFIYCLFSVFTTPNGIVYTYRKYLTSKKTEKKKEEGGGEIN